MKDFIICRGLRLMAEFSDPDKLIEKTQQSYETGYRILATRWVKPRSKLLSKNND